MPLQKLKPLFGDGALTFEQFSAALAASQEIKLADLSTGTYVDKNKYEAKDRELQAANKQLGELQTTLKKFDGVDVEALRTQISDAQKKYDTDVAALRLQFAVSTALQAAGARNHKVAAAALDASKLKLNGETVEGLSEQIEALKKSDAYLFTVTETGPEGTGAGGGSGGGGKKTDEMSDAEFFADYYRKKE